MFTDTRRGDIWMANIPSNPDITDSRTIRGYRPVLVVSRNETNKAGVMVSVIPMTSKLTHANGDTRVPLLPDAFNCLERPSLVLADQITTLDRRALMYWVGVASHEDMTQVEAAMRTALGTQ